MSDIAVKFEWWELLLLSPTQGWPGLLIGAALGAYLWKKRRILGGVLGAIVGNLLWFGALLLAY
jgi:hypothetical protein